MTTLARIVRGEANREEVVISSVVAPDATITIADLATGFIRAVTGQEMWQWWGQFVLREINISVESFESHPEWNTLLDAIWDIAYGTRPSDEAIRIARAILDQSTTQLDADRD